MSKEKIIPPKEVVDGARATMGAIDLDPYSTTDGNRLVQAARYFHSEQQELDDITACEWTPPGDGRVFLGPQGGAVATKRLLNKLLREYRDGHVKEAVIWLPHNESLIRVPWLWSFPVCLPFRRLRPTWYDDETDEFRTISPAFWSAVIYLPPVSEIEEGEMHLSKLARFYASFARLGRIVHDTENGSDDWEDAYEAMTGSSYVYR